MVDIALHQLPAAGTLTGTEILPIDDGATTLRTTVAAMRSGLAVSGHGHAVADITGLQASLDSKASTANPSFTGQMVVPAGTAAIPAISPSGDLNTGILYPAADTISISTGGSERMQVNAVGNFGIGTTATDRRITVKTTSDANPHLEFQQANVPDGGWWVNAISNGGHLVFSRYTFGNVIERLRITDDGQLIHGSGVPVVSAAGHLGLRSYTVATMPSAGEVGRLAFVANGAGGRRLAVADGSNWLWPDGSVVS